MGGGGDRNLPRYRTLSACDVDEKAPGELVTAADAPMAWLVDPVGRRRPDEIPRRSDLRDAASCNPPVQEHRSWYRLCGRGLRAHHRRRTAFHLLSTRPAVGPCAGHVAAHGGRRHRPVARPLELLARQTAIQSARGCRDCMLAGRLGHSCPCTPSAGRPPGSPQPALIGTGGYSTRRRARQLPGRQ